MRGEDMDPEQLADLHLRAASERDTTRTRGPKLMLDTAIVEHWPCRRGCGAMVPVNSTAIAALETNNAWLAKRREKPILKSQVVFCPTCEPIAKRERREREERAATEIAALTRELFSLIDNDLREASIATRLRELGHANVPALLREAKTRRDEKRRAAKGPRRNDL